ncbi:Heme A synthase, cytochrome oxidase biogenesis protein Cox15-CtaA [Enhygromyxa salina]|uniref:Heme A synthase, cytochrome oxidase biogenesis protein Cox15-CtaA n=1 Tax=Enhygromyxa salina TaxID=215803 RepID=A0A0C2CUF4_9BACT|nr:Heme A synthase, cytochrome oxidase biogenesis protein Cox15-CtaA [Enhygromyxa salina]
MAWVVLAYTLAVIVFGAWVRITGSGAGCGQHWPTCHGEVVHRPQSAETMIELTHRVTSGLSLVFAGGLMAWALRRFPRPHPARSGTVLAVVFLLVEALLGAGLVAFGLVEDDDSVARAVVMAIHLTNTCLLMGALGAAAWAGVDAGPRRLDVLSPSRHGGRWWLLTGALVAVLLVSMSGAVTALGDTLYPVNGAADGTTTGHFLQRMRIVHPLLACGVGLYLLWLAIALPGVPGSPSVRRVANIVAGLVVAQLCAGVVNIMLSAPGWMQLVHLALATSLWVALVLLWLEALSASALSATGSAKASAPAR